MSEKSKEELRKDVCEAIDMFHSDRRFNLSVAIASGDRWHSLFGLSLANMSVQMASKRLPTYENISMSYNMVSTSLLHQSRQLLVEKALIETHATHILFVDTDQTFPADTVHRLAAHGKMVVGANIVQRKIPMVPCAIGLDGKRLWTKPDSTGLEEVGMLGTGLVLINTKVFKALEAPFFLQPFDEKFGFVGEDTYFCNKLREAGIKLWVDHDLSKEVGHLGQFEYTFPVAWEQGFDDIGIDWKEEKAA
jgi:hypothetical protein